MIGGNSSDEERRPKTPGLVGISGHAAEARSFGCVETRYSAQEGRCDGLRGLLAVRAGGSSSRRRERHEETQAALESQSQDAQEH